MKQYFKQFILIIIISLSCAACEGDLNPQMYGDLTGDDAFSGPSEIEATTVALYYDMRRAGWGPYAFSDGSSFIMDEIGTEEWTTKWAWSSFLNGSWNGQENMSTNFYNWIIRTITRCTYVMYMIDKSSVIDDVKDEYIPQARALRAFFMFDIYRLYGPMPMVTDPQEALNPDPLYRPARPSEADMDKLIETELTEVAKQLPVEAKLYGRVTKGAALHYLLKFYMFKKNWSKAIDIADEIIGLNYYSLQDNYANIFTAKNERNKELIFVLRAEPIADYGNHAYANILPGNYASPHGNTVDGWNGHRMPWAFYDTFNDKDLRKKLIEAKYTNKSGGTVDLRADSDIGALPLKYGIDPEAAGVWAGNDKVLDRFAEVLLFKAEALNELNGPNQESVDIINKIRDRAWGLGVGEPGGFIVQEEFDKEFNGAKVGNFEIKTYPNAADIIDYTYDVDKTGKLSGQNSLHVKVNKSGTAKFTIQVRAENIPLLAGREYKTRFKIRSSKKVNIRFRIQSTNFDFMRDLDLEADQSYDKEFTGLKPSQSGANALFFALGNNGDEFDIWIDKIELEVLEKSAEAGDTSHRIKLADFSTKEDLRDWVLQERGWEFWYEGKRRQDLIRMGKYLEVAQTVGNNFTEKNLLFPIPNHVTTKNPNIKQNKGY